MLRKALVNDVVHSFCFQIRTGAKAWPLVILQQPYLPMSFQQIDEQTLQPFVTYALTRPNYVIAMRRIIYLASWLRAFSGEERSYAVLLMEKFYGIRSFKLDEPDVQRHDKQELPDTAKLPEYYELFDAV